MPLHFISHDLDNDGAKKNDREGADQDYSDSESSGSSEESDEEEDGMNLVQNLFESGSYIGYSHRNGFENCLYCLLTYTGGPGIGITQSGSGSRNATCGCSISGDIAQTFVASVATSCITSDHAAITKRIRGPTKSTHVKGSLCVF